MFRAASYPEFQVSELEDENYELDYLLSVQFELSLRAAKLSAQEGLRAYFWDQSDTDSDKKMIIFYISVLLSDRV